ncbi:MAG: hypothetical protein ACLFRP_07545 [Puniceicoccaceae bacterium]
MPRILEGDVPVGAEVRMPGAESTGYLYNRYNRSERRADDAGGRGAEWRSDRTGGGGKRP